MKTRISKHIPSIIDVFSELIKKYELTIEETGNYGMKMYNSHCAIHAGVGKYDETGAVAICPPLHKIT